MGLHGGRSAHDPKARNPLINIRNIMSQTLRGKAAGAGQVVDAFHAALRAGDTAKAAALLADDALIFEAGYAERSNRLRKNPLAWVSGA